MSNNLLTMLDAIAPNTRPVAVLKFERGTPGRENEMPRVVSCNWMPDGEYEVYLAAAPGVAMDWCRDTPGGTQYVVRRSGLAKPTTLHHSCHVEIIKDTP